MSLQSVYLQVLKAAHAVTGGEDASVFLLRNEAFTPDQLPADNIIPEPMDFTPGTSNANDLTLTFHVRHTAADTLADPSSPTPAAALALDLCDARFVRSQQLLLADLTLGGLVYALRPRRLGWEMESAESTTIALVCTYEAQFSTSRTDPSQPA